MNTRQRIMDFLVEHHECVLATINEAGLPEAATVGFSETPQLELTIGTNNSTRKYRNIQRDPHVAVTIGFSGNVTVQYEGVARVLEGDELEQRIALHFQKIPGAQHFRSQPGQVYLSITPTWVRITDYTQDDPVAELKEFA